MKHSWEVLTIATKLEKLSLQGILAQISKKYTKEVAPTMPERSEEQDKLYNEELQGERVDPIHATVKTATALRMVHEANRAQRDIEIINAGRKKLMKGCLDATAWRVEKLGRILKSRENTPQ